MADSVEARRLQFNSLDDVTAELKKLLGGYQKTGEWNLAQMANHLNDWMRFPMDGFPPPPLVVRVIMFVLRNSVGKRMLKQVLETKTMKAGSPTMPETVHTVDVAQDETAVNGFLETVERFKKHDGKIHPSPFFGEMDRDKLMQLQLIHCAHHLSFLVPNE